MSLMNVRKSLVAAMPLMKETRHASCFAQEVCCMTQEEDEDTGNDDDDKTKFGSEDVENYFDELLSAESFFSEDPSDH